MGAAEQILTSTTNVASTTNIAAIRYCQQCLLCENTRDLPEGIHYCNTPWVCDECKEAIAFVKDLRNSAKEVSEEESQEIKASIALL